MDVSTPTYVIANDTTTTSMDARVKAIDGTTYQPMAWHQSKCISKKDYTLLPSQGESVKQKISQYVTMTR